MILDLFRRILQSIKKRPIDASAISEPRDDYFAILDRYKFLRNEELPDVPDHVLENAVMSWMWKKFNDDWSNQLQVIESLPKPCQDVYACRTVIDEVNNGGLNQLFFNSTGQFAYMAQLGFAALGSERLSRIMDAAIDIYRVSKPDLEEHRDGTIESFMESYSEDPWEELTDQFFTECAAFDIEDRYIQYIRQHSDCFGDK